MSQSIYSFSVNTIKGLPSTLGAYEGRVLLVVNVASECGLTPQYEGLEKIYEKYQSAGLEVLAFPANEFGAQEPGSNSEIQSFCQTKFGIKFPLFEKIVVKGPGQHPLYKWLTETQPEAQQNPDGKFKKILADNGLLSGKPNDIQWNFEKFLINRKGQIVARFAPDIVPENPLITQAIEKELRG